MEPRGVRPGQLVRVAGGGVGGFAVQLAKYAGAHVIATAGPRSTEAVRRFGADQIVDYTATPVAGALGEPVDVVLNLVAVDAGQAAALIPLVRPSGVLVSITVPVEVPADSPVTATHFVVRNDTSHLAALVKLVDAGAVHVDVSASRPLADLASVHRDAESGRHARRPKQSGAPSPRVTSKSLYHRSGLDQVSDRGWRMFHRISPAVAVRRVPGRCPGISGLW
ncbi:zinc-binding dehydrogenase [Streptosporangium sp. LJ11]|uniref:zinc-binding dehydrogenase n=1 Tax=Streptosporangium sp. LJ11 TaxID=3436927 RepID=UPI003F79191C